MFNFKLASIILGEAHQGHIHILFTSPKTLAKIYKESYINMTEQNVSNDEFLLGFRDQSEHDRSTRRTFWTSVCLCLSLTVVGAFVLALMISRYFLPKKSILFFNNILLNSKWVCVLINTI